MDAYDIQARHAPVVLAITPLLLVTIALVPAVAGMKIAAGTIGFIIVAALPLVGIRIARSLGRARQSKLYSLWGGPPTTVMLRYRDPRVNARTKEIYRERLRRLGPAFCIPDEAEEDRDPETADTKIGAAMDEIRRRAKERTLRAVQRENINYGVARNAYGLKPFGLAACFIAGAVLVLEGLAGWSFVTPLNLVVGMAVTAVACIWIFGCTGKTVRHHGEAYALALFEAIDILVPANQPVSGRRTSRRRHADV